MRKTVHVALVFAGLLGVPGSAWAAPFLGERVTANGYAHSYMTYTTLSQVSTSRTVGYSGVGSLFVSTTSTATTGFGSLCTGSLIGANTVLTAAHCLAGGANDPVTGIAFFLPSFGDRGAATTEQFAASGYAVNKGYALTGLAGGNDIAAFTIGGDTTGHDTYGLFTGDPLQQFLEVGTGTVGGPAGTNIGTTSDLKKRVGSNLYEYYGNDVFSDSSHGVGLYDFDDGTAAHDVFGRNGGEVQLGIAGEASASPGDSGGPEFIDGRIASVTSFGITGGIFDGFCGGSSTDPYNNAGSTVVTALANCTNASVGEIGGNTLVDYNLDFVNGYLAGTIAINALPECSTWAMMIVGVGAVGGALRRRKAAVVRTSRAAALR